ncbi:MAG: hypothetical protein ACYS21_03095 [Planctomycetota bacterium]
MTKRITCRIISSVPLSKSGDASHYASEPRAGRREVRDVAVKAEVRRAGNRTIYSGPHRSAETPDNNRAIGRILDCYV